MTKQTISYIQLTVTTITSILLIKNLMSISKSLRKLERKGINTYDEAWNTNKSEGPFKNVKY